MPCKASNRVVGGKAVNVGLALFKTSAFFLLNYTQNRVYPILYFGVFFFCLLPSVLQMRSRETSLSFLNKPNWIMDRKKTSSILSTLKSVVVQYHTFASFSLSSVICHLKWNSSWSSYTNKLLPQFYICEDKMNCCGFKDILIVWPDALIENW